MSSSSKKVALTSQQQQQLEERAGELLNANPNLARQVRKRDPATLDWLVAQLSQPLAASLVEAPIASIKSIGESADNDDNRTLSAYCVKCAALREMTSPTATTLKNGREATRGQCPVCGTSLLKLGRQAVA